jgi:hypothetical protein
MGTYSDLVRRLADAGATPEMLAMVVEAFEQTIPTISAGAARQRRYRARKAEQALQSITDVTVVTPTVTPVTKESPPHTPFKEKPSPKENPPTGVKRKGSRVTADHRPNIEAAVAEGMPQHVAHQEARKFVDHFLALPGEKGVKLDWDATWRNWFRRAAEYRGIPLHDATGPPPGAGPSVEEIFAAARAKHAAAGTG